MALLEGFTAEVKPEHIQGLKRLANCYGMDVVLFHRNDGQTSIWCPHRTHVDWLIEDWRKLQVGYTVEDIVREMLG